MPLPLVSVFIVSLPLVTSVSMVRFLPSQRRAQQEAAALQGPTAPRAPAIRFPALQAPSAPLTVTYTVTPHNYTDTPFMTFELNRII